MKTVYDFTKAVSIVVHGRFTIASTNDAWRFSNLESTCESARIHSRSWDDEVPLSPTFRGLNWSTRSSKSLLWPFERDQSREARAHEDTNVEFLLQCPVNKGDKHVPFELLALLDARIRCYWTLFERQQTIRIMLGRRWRFCVFFEGDFWGLFHESRGRRVWPCLGRALVKLRVCRVGIHLDPSTTTFLSHDRIDSEATRQIRKKFYRNRYLISLYVVLACKFDWNLITIGSDQSPALPSFTMSTSSFSAAHRSYVKSLYRRMLKNELDWVVRRDIWRGRAMMIRAEFERNRWVVQRILCLAMRTSVFQ